MGILSRNNIEIPVPCPCTIKAQYGDSFSLTDKTLENLQDKDDTDDLPFDEVSPSIPKAYIIDYQGRPLHPSSAEYLLMNAEVLLPQGE